MSIDTDHPHPIVDIVEAGQILRKLHDQVCGDGKRVHLTRSGCDEACVMISCKELETLERALAIFADTTEFSNMCQMLSKILESADAVYAPPMDENGDSFASHPA